MLDRVYGRYEVGGSKVKAKDRVHEPADVRSDQGARTSSHPKIPKKLYAAKLLRLQEELVKMAEWVSPPASAAVRTEDA